MIDEEKDKKIQKRMNYTIGALVIVMISLGIFTIYSSSNIKDSQYAESQSLYTAGFRTEKQIESCTKIPSNETGKILQCYGFKKVV